MRVASLMSLSVKTNLRKCPQRVEWLVIRPKRPTMPLGNEISRDTILPIRSTGGLDTWFSTSDLALLLACSACSQSRPRRKQLVTRAEPARTARQVVDVGGHRVHLYCTGTGSPTVVIVGAGFSFNWGLVQPEVTKITQVCSYDHSGIGWSDDGPKDSLRPEGQRGACGIEKRGDQGSLCSRWALTLVHWLRGSTQANIR